MDDSRLLFGEMEAHDRIGAEQDRNDGRVYLSGWNGQHPYVDAILGDLLQRFAAMPEVLTSYSHLDEDLELAGELSDLHAQRYGEERIPARCFCAGAGSSAFLSSLVQYMHRIGHREICYVPPMYYNAIYWVRDLGFIVTKVCDRPPLNGSAELRLPRRRTCLWLTDPIWFAGRSVPTEVFGELRAWQDETGSTIVVDGTFQYMGWLTDPTEASSLLDPGLTYRLVCPTKALALHGFRFAYAITPPSAAKDFSDHHSRLHGASSLIDRLFAHRAVQVLSTGTARDDVWRFAKARYEAVRGAGVLGAHITPDRGYFLFAETRCDPAGVLGLNADCFELPDHPQHLRINLLDNDVVEYLLDAAAADA